MVQKAEEELGCYGALKFADLRLTFILLGISFSYIVFCTLRGSLFFVKIEESKSYDDCKVRCSRNVESISRDMTDLTLLVRIKTRVLQR